MSSLSRQTIALIVCFLFCHSLLCDGAQLLLMRIGTNIAFISHQAVCGKFLNNDKSLDNEMSMRDIITVKDETESEHSGSRYLL